LTFVGHQSLRNSHSSAARFNRSDSPRLPLTQASGAHLKSAPRTAGDITSLAAHEAGKSAALYELTLTGRIEGTGITQ
jgi:hypothetical protein